LDTYLALERVMMSLDDAGDPMGDVIRDAMDPIWYGLSAEEKAFLNSRGTCSLESLYPVRLPARESFFVPPVELPSGFTERNGEPLVFPASAA
jgi:hypothetical protein